MRKYILLATLCFCTVFFSTSVNARQPRAKFYDFSEQLIDGEIKRPTTLYTDSRQRVKFDRLLKLKKSFLPRLFSTAKEKVFK
jgi:hypothetical protein|tara:strand:- start:59 stop:307 length:249 start_codon:yes stop_codon:yes gene_type:complete